MLYWIVDTFWCWPDAPIFTQVKVFRSHCEKIQSPCYEDRSTLWGAGVTTTTPIHLGTPRTNHSSNPNGRECENNIPNRHRLDESISLWGSIFIIRRRATNFKSQCWESWILSDIFDRFDSLDFFSRRLLLRLGFFKENLGSSKQCQSVKSVPRWWIADLMCNSTPKLLWKLFSPGDMTKKTTKKLTQVQKNCWQNSESCVFRNRKLEDSHLSLKLDLNLDRGLSA